MRAVLSLILFLAVCGSASAEVGRACGARIEMSADGEARARFGDIWARCTPGAACTFTSQAADPSFPDGFRQALRINTAGPSAQQVGVALISLAPVIDLRSGAALSVDGRRLDISDGLTAFSRSREVVHVEGAPAAAVARALARAQRGAAWRFVDTTGQAATARFSLRGLPAARAWARCMAQRDQKQ